MARTILAIAALMICCIAADQKKDPAEQFQIDSIWKGQVQPDPRHAQRLAHPAQLHVLSRKDEKFTARFSIKDPNDPRAMEIEGVLKDGKFEAKVSKLIRGSWEKNTMNDSIRGEVKGEEMILERTNSKNLVATVRMRLDKKGHDDYDEKPGQK